MNTDLPSAPTDAARARPQLAATDRTPVSQ
jgi:hypothetical protein